MEVSYYKPVGCVRFLIRTDDTQLDEDYSEYRSVQYINGLTEKCHVSIIAQPTVYSVCCVHSGDVWKKCNKKTDFSPSEVLLIDWGPFYSFVLHPYLRWKMMMSALRPTAV